MSKTIGCHMRIVAAATLTLIVGTATAYALDLEPDQRKCQEAIAKEATKFVAGLLKVHQKCREAALETPCPAPDPAAISKLETKLRLGIAKRCDLGFAKLGTMGFPGACDDADPSNGFTLGDLQDCIQISHERAITGACVGGKNGREACVTLADCPDAGPGTDCRSILAIEYDRMLYPPLAPLSPATLACQKELAHSAGKFLITVLKSVQKCRNGINDCKTASDLTKTCRISGIWPPECATAEPATRSAIAKARSKAQAKIQDKCDDAMVAALKACEPDQTIVGGVCTGGTNGGQPCTQLSDCPDSGPGTSCAGAAPCETSTHQTAADDPEVANPSDLIDFEYATPRICGDNRLNQIVEECDGPQDSACPGLCGAFDGFFACLCQDGAHRRQRVVEHANADLDNGWTGKSHDSGIVEGGGFVTDLWDCDGPLGPDSVCAVGPTCSAGAKSPCSPGASQFVTGDSLCALGQGTCRTTPGAAPGPHCDIDFKKRCEADPDCPLPGDKCLKTLHGPPLPIVAAGVSVCIVNVFSEDVVGTTNLATGDADIRLAQRSIIHGGEGNHPCPVCGGFCEGNAGDRGPGARTLCATNADCPNPPNHCVTKHICSFGPNVDRPCLHDPPFGGATQFFGNPSVDCPPDPRNNISSEGLNIVFDPATTGTATRTANSHCNDPEFTGKACFGGANNGRPCTSALDCPLGSCNEQCFCPSTGPGVRQKPNICYPACVGGGNDASPCGDDTDCPGGFCHHGDCRLNPADADSCQEGICTVGPSFGTCSTTTPKSCSSDAGCRAPSCSYCDPGGTETCVFANLQCFVNGQIERCGTPGVPERVSAAIFCIAGINYPPIDGAAGLPGPGAITQPAKTIEVGF